MRGVRTSVGELVPTVIQELRKVLEMKESKASPDLDLGLALVRQGLVQDQPVQIQGPGPVPILNRNHLRDLVQDLDPHLELHHHLVVLALVRELRGMLDPDQGRDARLHIPDPGLVPLLYVHVLDQQYLQDKHRPILGKDLLLGLVDLDRNLPQNLVLNKQFECNLPIILSAMKYFNKILVVYILSFLNTINNPNIKKNHILVKI